MDSEARKFCDLGKECLEDGKPEEAFNWYERAIDVDPESSDAWCGRGKASYDMGRLERADRDFRRAIRFAKRTLPPERNGTRRWWSDPATRPYLRAVHGHGLCLFWLGAYEDAAKVFRRLLKLAPIDPLDVKFLVGETYLRLGRIERAIRELEPIEDDPDALYNLGLAKFYAGDFPGSVSAFRRGFFANLHLPPILCEKPSVTAGDDDEEGGRKKREELPSDQGTHPKGLDGEGAAHDYVDRCGDFWFGRPVVQRWLDGIRSHPLVTLEIEKHLHHLRQLQSKDLAAGARAQIEGENTTLRSLERIASTDRGIAADVLAKVFALPPEPPAKP